MRIDFWFDPGCPWTWITSRWMAEVAAARHHDVHWRTYSLMVKNGGADSVPERFRDKAMFAYGALRVIEAARRKDEAAAGRLYTEYGRRLHHDSGPTDHADVLEAVGLDAGLADAADDESLDAVIQASMDEAIALVGDEVAVPVIALPVDGGRKGCFGPVLSPAPTGDEALELFDRVAALIAQDSFFELKRARTSGPQLPSSVP